jgi:hypothetical protein
LAATAGARGAGRREGRAVPLLKTPPSAGAPAICDNTDSWEGDVDSARSGSSLRLAAVARSIDRPAYGSDYGHVICSPAALRSKKSPQPATPVRGAGNDGKRPENRSRAPRCGSSAAWRSHANSWQSQLLDWALGSLTERPRGRLRRRCAPSRCEFERGKHTVEARRDVADHERVGLDEHLPKQ